MKVYLAEVTDLDARHVMIYVYRSMEKAERDIIETLREMYYIDEKWDYKWVSHEDYSAYGTLGNFEVAIDEIDLGEADE